MHDLGQAAAHLALQANALGLQVHQMGGVNLGEIRKVYAIPEGHDPQTAIAIGYPDLSEPSDELAIQLRGRETGARQRRALSDQIFSGQWGTVAEFVSRPESR